MITGTSLPTPSTARRFRNSNPFISGILMSHRMRSRALSLRRANASFPLPASKTCVISTSARRRARSTIFRMAEESSTIKRRMLLIRRTHFLRGKGRLSSPSWASSTLGFLNYRPEDGCTLATQAAMERFWGCRVAVRGMDLRFLKGRAHPPALADFTVSVISSARAA